MDSKQQQSSTLDLPNTLKWDGLIQFTAVNHSIVVLDDLSRDAHKIFESRLALQLVTISLIVPPTCCLANCPTYLNIFVAFL